MRFLTFLVVSLALGSAVSAGADTIAVTLHDASSGAPVAGTFTLLK